MVNDKIIKVEYELYTSNYSIKTKIPKLLERLDIMSFDTETRSFYDKDERDAAKNYLKDYTPSDEYYKHARLVSSSSGLSYPSIIKTTHFIFGESNKKSHIVVCTSARMEMFMWNLISNYNGLLLVHNSLFDLKIMYERLGKLPKNFINTMLRAKCLINHVNIWKCKTSLKDLVGEYFPPEWSLYTDYEPKDLKDTKFLKYCACDGAGTFLLHELIEDELNNE